MQGGKAPLGKQKGKAPAKNEGSQIMGVSVCPRLYGNLFSVCNGKNFSGSGKENLPFGIVKIFGALRDVFVRNFAVPDKASGSPSVCGRLYRGISDETVIPYTLY